MENLPHKFTVGRSHLLTFLASGTTFIAVVVAAYFCFIVAFTTGNESVLIAGA